MSDLNDWVRSLDSAIQAYAKAYHDYQDLCRRSHTPPWWSEPRRTEIDMALNRIRNISSEAYCDKLNAQVSQILYQICNT